MLLLFAPSIICFAATCLLCRAIWGLKIVGLSGGIASGKTTFVSIIEKLGAKVVDMDKIAREVVQPGEPTLKKLAEAFGDEVINKEDGSLNRKLLGVRVFGKENTENRKKLDQIMRWPMRKRLVYHLFHHFFVQRSRVVVLDAALLYEMRLHKVERLAKRDNSSIEDAQKRIDSQMSLELKRKHANIICENDCSFEELQKRGETIWEHIRNCPVLSMATFKSPLVLFVSTLFSLAFTLAFVFFYSR